MISLWEFFLQNEGMTIARPSSAPEEVHHIDQPLPSDWVHHSRHRRYLQNMIKAHLKITEKSSLVIELTLQIKQ